MTRERNIFTGGRRRTVAESCLSVAIELGQLLVCVEVLSLLMGVKVTDAQLISVALALFGLKRYMASGQREDR